MSQDWSPPAASQPSANEGAAAGDWETDGPPHLNGFDPTPGALLVKARPARWLEAETAAQGTLSRQLDRNDLTQGFPTLTFRSGQGASKVDMTVPTDFVSQDPEKANQRHKDHFS